MAATRRLELSLLSLLVVVTIHTSLVLHGQILESLNYVPQQARADTAGVVEVVAQASADHQQYLERWQNNHGISFTTQTPTKTAGQYSWQLPSDDVHDQHIAYYRSFDQELAKYSPGFLRDAGVRQVYLIDSILLDQETPLLGFADVITGDLYFNIEAMRADTGLVKSTIHHEIAHIMFYQLFGSEMFSYESWPTQTNGYVSQYATTSLAEDMAEVFAHMQTNEYKQLLSESMASNQVIREKVQLVTQAAQTVDPSFGL